MIESKDELNEEEQEMLKIIHEHSGATTSVFYDWQVAHALYLAGYRKTEDEK